MNETVMTVNDLSCVFNLPPALKSRKNEQGEEVAQGLPPYAPQVVYKVDEYEDCPPNWMHGSSISGSFFVAVKPETGMWLDFNKNFNHKKHVAIICSIQGIDPLTGMSMVDIDQKISLKQFKHKCPKHDVKFQQELYCPECKYKWVSQNYLSTTNTPYGYLWIDGFRSSDGKVRQYYFTEEETKGVAHQILGAEKKTFSIGIAFYLSKEEKSKPIYSGYRGAYGSSISLHSLGSYESNSYELCAASPNKSMRARGSSLKSLDIGAGAVINQKVYRDDKNLDFWEDKPAALIYINYTNENHVKELLKSKRKEKEGFLDGLTVGK